MRIEGSSFRRAAGLARFCLLILFLIAVHLEAQAQSGAWKRKKDMPTGRAVISACVVNDTIYVIGGYDPHGVNYAANEAYHPPTDTWKVKKPLPKGRAFLSTAAVNGIIYAIGGGWPDATSEVLAYDPVTDTGWTQKHLYFRPGSEPQPLLLMASSITWLGIIFTVTAKHTIRPPIHGQRRRISPILQEGDGDPAEWTALCIRRRIFESIFDSLSL